MHFLRIIFCFVFGLAISFGVKAQDRATGPRKGSTIIDDTTKQIYGPKSSRYYYEQDEFFNRTVLYRIDTSVQNVHRMNSYVQRNDNLYQDLGNTGTAIQSIYYKPPDLIGSSSGFNTYNLYWDSEAVRYFDTKSPYTNLKIILGGKGKSITRVAFSRNITPRWNAGFTYRALLIDKQIQRTGKGDRNVRGTYYDFHTAFISKDSSYRLFANFRRNNQKVFEYGGVELEGTYEYKDFFSKNAQPWLTAPYSTELRNNLHLYQCYTVGKALQIYNTFDSYQQGNGFQDDLTSSPESYYDNVEVDSVQTNDYSKFKSIRNEVGIKGNLLKLFYNGYYAFRTYNMDYKYITEDTLYTKMKGVENYVGGRISMKLDSIFELNGWAELLQNGNYRIDAQLSSKWIEASLKQMQYSPSSLLQAYRASHDLWDNDFRNVNITQLNGYLHYKNNWLSVSPGLTFTTLTNYVFLKKGDYAGTTQRVLPIQSSGTQVIASPELKFSFIIKKHVTFTSQTIYTLLLNNSDNAIQVPEVFANGQLAYENTLFKNNLVMQVGVDVHWQSVYYPQGYDLPTQQFYVQQSYYVPDFPIVNLFFNARIKKARIFLKYNNLIQLFTQQGYMPTPDYPGFRNTLDFGVDWSFYD